MSKGRNKTGRRKKRKAESTEDVGGNGKRRESPKGPKRSGWLSEREYALLVRQWRAWKNMNITDMAHLIEGDEDE